MSYAARLSYLIQTHGRRMDMVELPEFTGFEERGPVHLQIDDTMRSGRYGGVIQCKPNEWCPLPSRKSSRFLRWVTCPRCKKLSGA